jgi:hypothetical protein
VVSWFLLVTEHAHLCRMLVLFCADCAMALCIVMMVPYDQVGANCSSQQPPQSVGSVREQSGNSCRSQGTVREQLGQSRGKSQGTAATVREQTRNSQGTVSAQSGNSWGRVGEQSAHSQL